LFLSIDIDPKGRKKATMTDGQVSFELTAITLNKEETNNRRKVMSKDVDVQTELTAIMVDDEQMNSWRHVPSEDDEIHSGSTHLLNRIHLQINAGDIFDHRPVAATLENSGNTQDNSMTKNRRIVETMHEESKLIPMKIINDIRANLRPIVGYAVEPLLPLFKACAPLTNIVHNLSFYVQIALNETSEEPPDGLSIDESAAIRLYTIEWERPHRSLYSMLNQTLKEDDRECLRPYFKYLKLFLTALAKLPCAPPLTVWRGVAKNLSAEFPPGTPVTWWAFTSCTTELTVLENNVYLGKTGSRTLFSVEAINGRTIRVHSHFVTEEEILLLPGTQMIVQSQFSPAPDLHIIHLKQVLPNEVLLQPPFEGILNISYHLFSFNTTISIYRCTSLSEN
jgi:hypothetical protein